MSLTVATRKPINNFFVILILITSEQSHTTSNPDYFDHMINECLELFYLSEDTIIYVNGTI